MTNRDPHASATEETGATDRRASSESSTGTSTRIPASRLLAELRRLADEKGRAPSRREMDKEGRYGSGTFGNRFGSWTKALRKLGVEPCTAGRGVEISKQDVKDSIRALADQLGHVPTVSEMASQGSCSPKTAQTRYGSWNNALRAAEFEPNQEFQISEDELLSEIHRLTEELGHPPSTNDLKRDGKFSHRPYFRRFEGWHSALRAAGYEPRGWLSGPENPKWEGGRNSLYYGPNYEVQRHRALKRDHFRCRMPGCKMTREDHCEKFGKDLHIHHVVPVREFLESDTPDYEMMNDLDNLVTLCATHHTFWEKLSPLRPDIRYGTV